jgi:hypothetical protein
VENEPHEGEATEGYSHAVHAALDKAAQQYPDQQLSFEVVAHSGTWSANPGTINHIVKVVVTPQ